MVSKALIALSGFIALLAIPLAAPAQTGETTLNGISVQSVRKTCECVRRHPSGFPYVEQRITECKTYKDNNGRVKALDCINCYAVCTDKPSGSSAEVVGKAYHAAK